MASRANRRANTRKTDEPESRALVFISHDTRDHGLAEAFENLIRDASGGVLKTFRSSDRKGYSGIAFGAEWYATVMERLVAATDVVALITKNSLNRPWILYEVGVARGRSNVPAFGIAFQIPMEQVTGPFAQFQNSPDDEESLTKLVLQLIRRIPDAAPREEAARLHVRAFRSALPKLIRGVPTEDPGAQANALMFEEVKSMFRLLSDQLAELGRRWPFERRQRDEDDEPIPAWVEQTEELVKRLEHAKKNTQRHALWKRISAIVSARTDVVPRGMASIRDGLQANDAEGLRNGLSALREYLRDEGGNLARDENDLYAFNILARLATIAEDWVPTAESRSKPTTRID